MLRNAHVHTYKTMDEDVVQCYRYLYAVEKYDVAKIRWLPHVEEPDWFEPMRKKIKP